MWDPYVDFKKEVLPNGLEIYVAHWPGRSWVKTGFIIHAGAARDCVGLEGTAHFVEHLVSENGIVSNKTIRDFFKGCGGRVNFGSTGYFFTNYKFTLPATSIVLMKGINYFADMLIGARLQKCIERERNVIQQEINNKFGAQCVIDAALQQSKAIFEGFFRARFVSPFGLPQTVDDIDQHILQNFYDKYYHPSNMSLVFVGGMSMDEIIAVILQTTFSQNSSSYRTKDPVPVKNVTALSNRKLTLCFSDYNMHGIERSAFITVAKVPQIRNRIVFEILSNMLNEILFEEIREKQALAYRFDSGFCDLRYFTEIFMTGIIKKDSEKDVSDTVAKIIERFYQYEELFDKIKNDSICNLLLVDVNGCTLRNNAMVEIGRERRIISIQEDVDNYIKTCFDDVLCLVKFLAPQYRHEYIQIP